MRLIGILGGTFNPIHFGHLRMAQEIAYALDLDEVRFIPAAHPPHRAEPSIMAEQRLAMVNIAIEGNARFTLDDRELKREGRSYSIDTLASLRQELGDDVALCWMMGNDAFLGLPNWHRWEELLEYCHIIVAYRPAPAELHAEMPEVLRNVLSKHQVHDLNKIHNKPAGHVYMQDITALDISATHIRATLEQGLSARYLLPEAVLSYIHQHQLYQLPEES